jgi:arylsulfatase A-like enzyme
VTSDHGEGLMDHNHLNHGVHIYEEAVHVPLIMRWPARIVGGASVSTPVELTDVAPTILDLVRTAADRSGDPRGGPTQSVEPGDLLSVRGEFDVARGRSLVPLLFGGGDTARGPIFFYRRHYDGSQVARVWAEGERFGIRDGRWKYLRGDGPEGEELFDLEKDPAERQNLFSVRPEVARRLSERLDVWHRSVSREDTEPDALSAQDRARLEALGYVE